MQKQGSARWAGDLKSGQGSISTESGALKDQPYGFGTRFNGQRGTNPEELIGAAHAACSPNVRGHPRSQSSTLMTTLTYRRIASRFVAEHQAQDGTKAIMIPPGSAIKKPRARSISESLPAL